MFIKSQILILFFIFSLQTLYSQSTGVVIFNIRPEGAIVKVNETIINLKEQNKAELTQGTYPIQVWVSGLTILHDTIQIIAGETLQYNKGLKNVTPEFKQFQTKQKKYFTKKVVNISTGIAIIGSNIIATTWVLNKNSKFKQSKIDALNSKLGYEESIFQNDIDLKKSSMKKIKRISKNCKKGTIENWLLVSLH